jgi:hypothetical protein
MEIGAMVAFQIVALAPHPLKGSQSFSMGIFIVIIPLFVLNALQQLYIQH